MPKNISIPDKVFSRMRRYGIVGQSYGDLIDDLLNFVDEHEDEFEEYLNNVYGDEDEDEED